ncbi:MAG TPA: DNA gyrase C-terminal beta-propeller domain-containing protein, partial [Dongiaceae bacterium]
IANIDVSARNGMVAASFPVGTSDQIMLVTDGGQLIRCPVHDIRIARRQTQGVMIFRVAEDEHVVAVAHLADLGEEVTGDEDGAENGSTGETIADVIDGSSIVTDVMPVDDKNEDDNA